MANLYLVGMMGSGKSVTAKKLAPLVGGEFVDLDEKLQQKTGHSINEIFEKKGESAFREQEACVLNEVSALDKQIVATGGGIVLRPHNVKRMKLSGKICFLETSFDVLWDRVKGKKDRPLLRSEDPKKTLEKIYLARLPVYREAADFTVNTDGQTAEAVAEKIFEVMKKKGIQI